MSLINDALKRARQAPPVRPQSPFPNLPPAAERPASALAWLIPAIVIVLVVAAIFFMGWAMAHRSVQKMAVATPIAAAAAAPAAVLAPAAVAPVTAVVTAPVVVAPTAAPTVNPPDAPKLQGIFYSPTAPAAIVNGKTVRPGDPLLQYHVTEITQFSVTLADASGKSIKLTLGN